MLRVLYYFYKYSQSSAHYTQKATTSLIIQTQPESGRFIIIIYTNEQSKSTPVKDIKKLLANTKSANS
jgi:hypothetical protein